MASISSITDSNGITYDIKAKYDSEGNQINSTYVKTTDVKEYAYDATTETLTIS